MVVFAKNNNNVAVDLKIEVEFYDASGVIVGSDSRELEGIGANSEIAKEMWSTPNKWDSYKIYADAEQTSKNVYFDNIEVKHNISNKKVAVQVKNNSEDVIDYITVSVVYYQGETVVGIDDSIKSDTKPGRSANFTLDYPYDKKYKNVKFDNYKVFVTEAYSYE